jgi:hypothetical protein
MRGYLQNLDCSETPALRADWAQIKAGYGLRATVGFAPGGLRKSLPVDYGIMEVTAAC